MKTCSNQNQTRLNRNEKPAGTISPCDYCLFTTSAITVCVHLFDQTRFSFSSYVGAITMLPQTASVSRSGRTKRALVSWKSELEECEPHGDGRIESAKIRQHIVSGDQSFSLIITRSTRLAYNTEIAYTQ